MSIEEKTETNEGAQTNNEIDELLGSEEQVDDTTLAEDALEATEEESSPAEESADTESEETEEAKTEEKEPEKLSEEQEQLKAKDSKIASLKHELKDRELASAKLTGQLEERQSINAQNAEPEKGPLELALEAQGITDPDELEKPYSVMQAQHKWEKEQDAKQVQKEADSSTQSNVKTTTAVQSLQEGELSVTEMGEGLDFKSVMTRGQHLLTPDDLKAAGNVSDAYGQEEGLKEAYHTVIRRLKQSGVELKPKVKSQPKPKPKAEPKPKAKGKPTVDSLLTEGDNEVEGEAEEVSNDVIDFLFEKTG